MATAAATVDPGLEAAFQTTCETVDALSVAVLDEKQPERDWHRWMQALFDAVATRPGISRSYGVRGGSFRARCTDSGLVQTDGDRRPSRSTNGSRYPRLVPSDLRLGLWQHRSTAWGGSREVGVLLKPPCSGCVPASSSAQRQMWRSLGARSMLDARSFMISTLRSQVSFAAAVAHSRLRLSRLELIGCSGRTLWPHRRPLRVCRARLHFADRLRAGAGRQGEALWEGSGWRQGRVRWGPPLLSRPRGAVGSGPAAVESATVSAVAWCSCGCVVGFGWL